jgi:hypothetical protein
VLRKERLAPGNPFEARAHEAGVVSSSDLNVKIDAKHGNRTAILVVSGVHNPLIIQRDLERIPDRCDYAPDVDPFIRR